MQLLKITAMSTKINTSAQAKPKIVLSQQMKPIRPNDVLALVLWILADRTEGKNPQWAFVQASLEQFSVFILTHT